MFPTFGSTMRGILNTYTIIKNLVASIMCNMMMRKHYVYVEKSTSNRFRKK